MTGRLSGLVLALVLIGGLIVTAPARLVSLLAPDEGLILQGFSGTLWRGSASRALVQVGPGYFQLGSVDWTLNPLSLLLFRPGLEMSSHWGRQNIAARLVIRGGDDVSTRDLSANFSSELIKHYLPVALEGELSLQFDRMHIRDGLPYEVQGRLVWQSAAWLSPGGLRRLGSYAVDLRQAPGESLQGQVITLTGPLTATGSVQVQGNEYDVDIQLVGDGAMDPQLGQAISLVGVPEAGGYRVRLQGKL